MNCTGIITPVTGKLSTVSQKKLTLPTLKLIQVEGIFNIGKVKQNIIYHRR
jgi:hypothetical protein